MVKGENSLIPKRNILLLTLIIGLCAFALVCTAASSGVATCHCCESSDNYGAKKDCFYPDENVYITGSGFAPCTAFNIYVVVDTTWCDQMSIPSPVVGPATTVSSDASGNILPTILWQAPLTTGKYDIVIDVDGDCKYDKDIDCLDDNDIQVTAGFFVIPDFVLGTIMSLTGCFAAFVVFRMLKSKEKANPVPSKR